MHCKDWEGEYHEWWGAFRAFLWDCFDKTHLPLNAVAAQTPAAIGNIGGDDGGDGGDGRTERGGHRRDVEKGAGEWEPARWFPLQPSHVLPPAGGGKGRVEFLG